MKIPLDWLSHAAEIAAKATHPTTITLTTEGFIIVALSNASPAATATSEIKFKVLAGSVASPFGDAIRHVNMMVDRRLAAPSA